MYALLFILLAESSPGPPLERANEVRTADKHRNLTHYIFWRWTVHHKKGVYYGQHDVVAWRMADKCKFPPVYDRGRKKWVLRFWDKGCVVTVLARSYRCTKTSFDVEVDERTVLKVEMRQGLW